MRRLSQVGFFSPAFQRVFFPPMFLGFAVLAGMFPFHTWSPPGHVAAPTAVAMLHAGVVMKLGAYGCLRAGVWLMPEGADHWLLPIAVAPPIQPGYWPANAPAPRRIK